MGELYLCPMKIKGFALFFSLLLFLACNTKPKDVEVNNESVEKFSPEVSFLQSQLLKFPDSVGLRLKLAILLDSIGQSKTAILHVDTLLQKDSLNYGLWFTHGQIAEDIPDTAMAIRSYENAIAIYNSPDALLALANLYAEQKNQESLVICSRLNDMSLGREYDAHCHFISGVYFARTGNREKALAEFDACIANNYTYMEAYIEKGLLFFDNKDYAQALKVFNFASGINRLDPDPYYWMGRCYEMQQNKDSALLRFQQSYHLDKSDEHTIAAIKRLGGKVE